MAGAIDTLRVDVLQWNPDYAQTSVEVFTRPGVDGAGIHTGGSHPVESQAESWTVYEDPNEADAHRISAGQLVGQVVDITRASGVVAEGVAILSSRTVVLAGGGGRWIVRTVWRLLSEG